MGLLTNKFQDNVIVEKLDKLLSWSRSTSPWFFQFGTACYAKKMLAFVGRLVANLQGRRKPYDYVYCNADNLKPAT